VRCEHPPPGSVDRLSDEGQQFFGACPPLFVDGCDCGEHGVVEVEQIPDRLAGSQG
jgi:hypothetical protein